jgi:hypothetical protein
MFSMSKIFISYRRQDSRDITGRIYDRLLRHWEAERIFKDVDNIDPGEDYRDVIDREISQCALFLAVIGPSWLTAKKADGKRRLDDPTDMVRIEIESALSKNQRVIPVIVGDGRMPEPEELPESLRELSDRHAFPVRPDPDFHRDMDRLVKLIERAMASREPLVAELIDPHDSHVTPPPVQPHLTDPPHGSPRPYGLLESASAPSGSYHLPPAHGRSDGGMLFPAALAVSAVCLVGIVLCSLMMIGAFASITDPEGVDHDVDAVMAVACAAGWAGNLLGFGAAACMFFRKFYWGALLGVCGMGLGTLVFCPVINLPAAIWALLVLTRPEVRAAFDTPAEPAGSW